MGEISGRAFVVRPFNQKSNAAGDACIDFERVGAELIDVALQQIGLSGSTTAEFVQQGNIRFDMFTELLAADVVIADISIHNANVFYELGIRHALQSQYTIMIKADKRGDAHVFDLSADRYLPYDPDDPAASVDALVNTVSATLESERADSPVFQLVPGLESFDASKVVVVPRQFRETVEQRARDRDGLASLFDKATVKPWATEGLRVVGRAQFDLGDHEGSRKTWEYIRNLDQMDLEANQKLATNFQKLGDLTRSRQAAQRALDSSQLGDWDCAETYALIASNVKTEWHASWSHEANVEERQSKALTSPLLRRSLDGYCTGFEKHRSHYYSGVNAVAMLSIQLELAKRHPRRWLLAFDNEKAGALALEASHEHLQKLIAATDLAIESSIKNYQSDEWAQIARADMMLLCSDNAEKVRFGYEQCTGTDGFNATSLQRQLKIYCDLALFSANVEAALSVVMDEPVKA